MVARRNLAGCQETGAVAKLVQRRNLAVVPKENAVQRRNLAVVPKENAVQRRNLAVVPMENAVQRRNLAVVVQRGNPAVRLTNRAVRAHIPRLAQGARFGLLVMMDVKKVLEWVGIGG